MLETVDGKPRLEASVTVASVTLSLSSSFRAASVRASSVCRSRSSDASVYTQTMVRPDGSSRFYGSG